MYISLYLRHSSSVLSYKSFKNLSTYPIPGSRVLLGDSPLTPYLEICLPGKWPEVTTHIIPKILGPVVLLTQGNL